MLTVKSGTPILPSTLKTGNTIPVAVKQILSSNNMVKLALPSQQQQQQHQLIRTSSSGHVIKPQRIILPSPVTSSTPSTEPIIQQTKIVPFSESKVSWYLFITFYVWSRPVGFCCPDNFSGFQVVCKA
jgi:transcriptional accessory protein Tex/SPT6